MYTKKISIIFPPLTKTYIFPPTETAKNVSFFGRLPSPKDLDMVIHEMMLKDLDMP